MSFECNGADESIITVVLIQSLTTTVTPWVTREIGSEDTIIECEFFSLTLLL